MSSRKSAPRLWWCFQCSWAHHFQVPPGAQAQGRHPHSLSWGPVSLSAPLGKEPNSIKGRDVRINRHGAGKAPCTQEKLWEGSLASTALSKRVAVYSWTETRCKSKTHSGFHRLSSKKNIKYHRTRGLHGPHAKMTRLECLGLNINDSVILS